MYCMSGRLEKQRKAHMECLNVSKHFEELGMDEN
jgi:hypothetical protein